MLRGSVSSRLRVSEAGEAIVLFVYEVNTRKVSNIIKQSCKINFISYIWSRHETILRGSVSIRLRVSDAGENIVLSMYDVNRRKSINNHYKQCNINIFLYLWSLHAKML